MDQTTTKTQRFIWLSPDFQFDTIDLSDAAYVTHVFGALWSAKYDLDYLVPKDDAQMIYTRGDPASAITELIEVGFWEDYDVDHWRITHSELRMVTRAERRKLAKMSADQQANRGPNKLELAGYAILNGLAVPYERQVMFEGKFTPDATIPSAKLVVQFDGEYWHDRAGTSTDPARIRQVQRDRAQDAYIRACGWEVIRFWETDIHQDPQGCAEMIRCRLRNGTAQDGSRRGESEVLVESSSPSTARSSPVRAGLRLAGSGRVYPDGRPCDRCGVGPSRITSLGGRLCAGCETGGRS